jgi:hypothetical protein
MSQQASHAEKYLQNKGGIISVKEVPNKSIRNENQREHVGKLEKKEIKNLHLIYSCISFLPRGTPGPLVTYLNRYFNKFVLLQHSTFIWA